MTAHDEKRIADIVRSWPAEPLTWDEIVEKVARDLRKPQESDGRNKVSVGAGGWSRQAIAGRASIKKAYDARRVELAAERERVKKRPTRNRDPELVMLRREREALQIENEQLREALAKYEERFGLRVYNRALGKTAEDDLEAPIKPKIDRLGRT